MADITSKELDAQKGGDLSDKLLDCPFCGNEQIAAWSYLLTPPEAYQWRCGCIQCGTMGGIRNEREEAIIAWNTRAEHALCKKMITEYVTTNAGLVKQLATTQQALNSAVEALKWQEITTIPKDGNKVEAWHKIHKCITTVKYIVDKRFRPISTHTKQEFAWLAVCGSNTWPEEAFTHWRPLTESPKAALASIKE